MSTIKSFTDIQQSRKLAEILPLESADMLFQLGEDKYADSIRVPLTKKHWEQMMPDINPCWSLAAMIEHLRKHNLFPEIKDADDYILMDITFYDEDEAVGKVINPVHFIRAQGKNILDACYEFVLKLHELNLL